MAGDGGASGNDSGVELKIVAADRDVRDTPLAAVKVRLSIRCKRTRRAGGTGSEERAGTGAGDGGAGRFGSSEAGETVRVQSLAVQVSDTTL